MTIQETKFKPVIFYEYFEMSIQILGWSEVQNSLFLLRTFQHKSNQIIATFSQC